MGRDVTERSCFVPSVVLQVRLKPFATLLRRKVRTSENVTELTGNVTDAGLRSLCVRNTEPRAGLEVAVYARTAAALACGAALIGAACGGGGGTADAGSAGAPPGCELPLGD